MISTLKDFQEKYYKYRGMDMQAKLKIRGYESAWLVDLAGANILENTHKNQVQSLSWNI